MNILPWHTNQEEPEDRNIVFVLINGKIAADVFVWFGKRKVFITHSMFEDDMVENKVKLDEVDAWMKLGDLPLPVWVSGRA
jgi:hypothetical protein